MKWLADENIERSIVAWLRQINHDVLWAAESMPGTPDEVLLDVATDQARIVITNDRDFGELVFLLRRSAQGVLYLRLPLFNETEKLNRLMTVWPIIEQRLTGHFIVVSGLKLRIRPLVN